MTLLAISVINGSFVSPDYCFLKGYRVFYSHFDFYEPTRQPVVSMAGVHVNYSREKSYNLALYKNFCKGFFILIKDPLPILLHNENN